MNDLSLHTRLTFLADDLAPDVDPYEQAAAARGLHRRQRRTRLGIAGAALAVAVVAVGVPTAVGTLSASGDGEVARPPSTSEPLRGPADAVRTAMSWWEADGSVPDPEAGTPCPDAAEMLSGMDSRYVFRPSRINSGGGTLAGCGWSTDDGSPDAETRIDLLLQADPTLDADLLVSNVGIDAAQDGCDFTTLFADGPPNVLQLCDRGGQRLWHLTVVDEDGTGAWRLTAAVGTEVDAAFRMGASSLATMWGIVSGVDDAVLGEPEEQEPDPLAAMAEALGTDLETRAVASVPEPAPDTRCPEAAAALSKAIGMYEIAPAGPETLTREGCTWSLATPATSAWDGLTLGLRSDPALDQETLTRQYDAERNRGGCYPSAMPGSVGFSALLVCDGEAGTSWTLTVLADDGTGGWVLTANVGADLPEAFGTGKASVLALREVVVGGL